MFADELKAVFCFVMCLIFALCWFNIEPHIALSRVILEKSACLRNPRIASDAPKRLFVDLDGTVAEWRNLKVESEEELYSILMSDGYYRWLRPYRKILGAVRRVAKQNENVFILTHYIPNCAAKADKDAWIDEYLPEIPPSRRIFVPCSDKKEDYVPGGVRKGDILLDDYTRNLLKWPGIGVKAINPINHTRQTWKGSSVGYKARVGSIANLLSALLK